MKYRYVECRGRRGKREEILERGLKGREEIGERREIYRYIVIQRSRQTQTEGEAEAETEAMTDKFFLDQKQEIRLKKRKTEALRKGERKRENRGVGKTQSLRTIVCRRDRFSLTCLGGCAVD